MKKTLPFSFLLVIFLLVGCRENIAVIPDFSQKITASVSFYYDNLSCTLSLDFLDGRMEADITSPPSMSRLFFSGENGRITLGCDDISQSYNQAEISASSPIRLLYTCLCAAHNADYNDPDILRLSNENGICSYNLHSETGTFLLSCNSTGAITEIAPDSSDITFSFVYS